MASWWQLIGAGALAVILAVTAVSYIIFWTRVAARRVRRLDGVAVPEVPMSFPMGSMPHMWGILTPSDLGPVPAEQKRYLAVERAMEKFAPDSPVLMLWFMASPRLVVRDPVLSAQFLQHPAMLHRVSSPIADRIFQNMGIVFINDVPKWHAHRKAALTGLMRPVFLRQVVNQSVFPICRTWLDSLWAAAGTSRVARIEAVESLARVTFEVIGEAALSVRFGSFDPTSAQDANSTVSRFRAAVTETFEVFSMNAIRFPWWRYFPDRALEARLQQAGFVREFVSGLIDQRRAARAADPTREGRDLLDLLLDESGSGEGGAPPEHFTNADIVFTIADMLVAGHETTSHTLSWALFFLGQDQALQQELRDAVVAAWRDGPTYESLSSIDLAHAIILETLRMRPTVAMVPRRAAEDAVIAGYTIAKDTMVITSPYMMGRDPTVYEEPERFDPHRFIRDRNLKAPLSFGTGQRSCIGERLAMLEAKAVLCAIVHAASVRLVTPAADVHMYSAITMRPFPRLEIELTRL